MKQSKRTVHLWKINIILLSLLFVGFSYVNNVENTHVSTTIGDYLSGVNNIINGGFENNSISSNYEYITYLLLILFPANSSVFSFNQEVICIN